MSDDRDAFGRKQGEDGLGDLGWGSSGSAPSAPTPAPAPVDPPKMTMNTGQRGMPVVVRDGRSGGGRILVAVVGVAILAAVGGILGVAGGGSSSSSSSPISALPAPGKTTASTDPESSKPPPQVTPLKLFTPGGLRSALKILQRDVPGKIDNFRLAADRIDVIVVHGNQRIDAQVTPDAEVANRISVSENPIPLTDSLRYDQIDVGAPARLIRSSNERVNQSRNDVDYLVWGFAGNNQWNLYYKKGIYTEGDAHGQFVRRIS